MLTFRQIRAPRGKPAAPPRRHYAWIGLGIVAILVLGALLFYLWRVWSYADPNAMARERYGWLLTSAREWTISPARARERLEEAQQLGRSHGFDTSEADTQWQAIPVLRDIPSGSTIKVREVERTAPHLVVNLTAYDDQGKPITALTRGDFIVSCDNRILHHVTVAESNSKGTTQSIALVFDCSSSMEGAKLTAAKGAIRQLRSIQGPQARYELITFDSDAIRRTPFTSDWSRIETSVDALQANGATALYKALALAAADLTKEPGIKSVIVITDGNDSLHQTTLDQVLAVCRQASIPVHTIGFASPDLNTEVLRRLARETGGGYYQAESASACGEQVRAALAAVRTPCYRLAIIDAEPFQKPLSIRLGTKGPTVQIASEGLATDRKAATP